MLPHLFEDDEDENEEYSRNPQFNPFQDNDEENEIDDNILQ